MSDQGFSRLLAGFAANPLSHYSDTVTEHLLSNPHERSDVGWCNYPYGAPHDVHLCAAKQRGARVPPSAELVLLLRERWAARLSGVLGLHVALPALTLAPLSHALN